MITRSIGICLNNGEREQLNFCGDLAGSFDAEMMDAIERAPFSVSKGSGTTGATAPLKLMFKSPTFFGAAASA